MNSLVLALIAFVGYIVAYNTYGKWLARKLFDLKDTNPVPSKAFKDGVDYVPTKRHILLGHHFTTIAGTGPIVGPAIGVIWGWLPAFLWVFLGPIFAGAVHDFASLVISSRHGGKTIGEMTRGIVSNRVGIIFLILIQFLLWLVLAVFAMIMGILFNMYPQSVLSVWMEIPIAIWVGYMVYKKGKKDTVYSIIGLILLYVFAVIGIYLPLKIPQIGGVSPIVSWIIILLVYSYFASVLPVQTLLQPRDYINSHELLVLMAALFLGVLVARPQIVAPAYQQAQGAPSLWPLLFVTIACGAISGFHSLAASGTTVKQLEKETDAQFVGYGGMLLEGSLSVLIILAVTAGIGMYGAGSAGYFKYYSSWSTTAGAGLAAQLKAIVEGASNLMSAIGIPKQLGATLMAIFVVSFAGTTLDSATRIQRFGLEELFRGKKDGKPVGPFKNRYFTTFVVVFAAFALCMVSPDGKGALKLWPVFGALNQLLAGLALMIATVYLAKKRKPIWPTLLPMIFMLIATIWATALNIRNYYLARNWLLVFIAVVTLIIAVWMIVEAFISTVIAYRKKQVYQEEFTKSVTASQHIHID
ncbi:MAG: Carbon starvation protein CstA [Thermotoga sp. 50_1627]|uniref:carbon starvation CstA family protein n=1 Tax=Pseudothermotoga sp. TaxID=2033661 RepID=UPI00076CB229|nr:MAG: Carbon starvation protein CstA [Thermotoga sp. 50_64]KUK24400.1 MAG: Carbon starvation protein CstA [Thermotoga sp. 50_1627]MBC7116422.1 carbon starvation protein A [Pseudothermotoga sp.]MDK2923511.1 carbon starvation protein [Pseudothermotoga sp.]HBT39791.1 carbon starvation protein A [Pseudothermotoga sp.]